MALLGAGKFDRRITIQVVDESTDAAGDVVRGEYAEAFKLWAQLRPRGAGIERQAPGGVLREFDTVFAVRDRPKARSLSPALHRVLWKGRIYELIGVAPDVERADVLMLLVSSRPDKRGSRGDEGVSDGP